MSQIQYSNKKLTKTQNELLNSMSIKYDVVKNEIDSKLNNLIKILLNELTSFFENVEELSKERKKFKEYENIQKENETLTSKLKEKTLNEQKLKSNIESLQREIGFLKNDNKNKNIEKNNLSASRNITNKSFLRKHVKGKSEIINNKLVNTLNHTMYKTKANIFENTTYKTKANIFESSKQNKTKKFVPNTAMKNFQSKKMRDNNSNDKYKTNKTFAFIEKKDILNSSNQNEKIIKKIKKYGENRMNEKIKKIVGIKYINRNKFKKKLNAFSNTSSHTKQNSFDIKEENEEKILKTERKGKETIEEYIKKVRIPEHIGDNIKKEEKKEIKENIKEKEEIKNIKEEKEVNEDIKEEGGIKDIKEEEGIQNTNEEKEKDIKEEKDINEEKNIKEEKNVKEEKDINMENEKNIKEEKNLKEEKEKDLNIEKEEKDINEEKKINLDDEKKDILTDKEEKKEEEKKKDNNNNEKEIKN